MTEINFDGVAFGRSPTNSVEPPVEESRRSDSPTGRTLPEGATPNPKKRRYPPRRDDEHQAASAEPSRLPVIHESRHSAAWDLRARKASPWDFYEKVFNLDLNGPVTVAQRKAPLSGLVAVKTFSLPAAEKALFMHKRARHDCIVEALDAFTTDTSFHVILEHMPVSLEQIVHGAKYPTERQLATILGQVRQIWHLRSIYADVEHGRSSTAWVFSKMKNWNMDLLLAQTSFSAAMVMSRLVSYEAHSVVFC
jgi:hypothetical protein